MTDHETLQGAFDLQTGEPIQVVGNMLDLAFNNPMMLAFAKLNEDYLKQGDHAPMLNGGGQMLA